MQRNSEALRVSCSPSSICLHVSQYRNVHLCSSISSQQLLYVHDDAVYGGVVQRPSACELVALETTLNNVLV